MTKNLSRGTVKASIMVTIEEVLLVLFAYKIRRCGGSLVGDVVANWLEMWWLIGWRGTQKW